MVVDVELVRTNKYLGLQLEHLCQLVKLTNNNNNNNLLLLYYLLRNGTVVGQWGKGCIRNTPGTEV